MIPADKPLNTNANPQVFGKSFFWRSSGKSATFVFEYRAGHATLV